MSLVGKVCKAIFKEKAKKPSVKFKNNSDRLISEYRELKEHNKELYNIIEDLVDFVNRAYDKELVVTMIFRTDEEQDHIYKDNPKYIKKKFRSPHQFWHGCDIRSKTFQYAEIKGIEDYLNDKYNSGNYYKWTAKDHNVGHGSHFHLQFAAK